MINDRFVHKASARAARTWIRRHIIVGFVNCHDPFFSCVRRVAKVHSSFDMANHYDEYYSASSTGKGANDGLTTSTSRHHGRSDRRFAESDLQDGADCWSARGMSLGDCEILRELGFVSLCAISVRLCVHYSFSFTIKGLLSSCRDTQAHVSFYTPNFPQSRAKAMVLLQD